MSESSEPGPRSEGGASDPARAAAIVEAYASGEVVTSLSERLGVGVGAVYAAIRASSESDLRERHVAARVALDRAALAERARAYAEAHPGFALADAYAAVEHRPRDRGFLRDVLEEAARATGRSSARESRESAARAAEMVAARAAGETLEAIGARYRVTRERVRQIVGKRGPRAAEAIARARAEREAEDAARVVAEEEARLAGVAERLLEVAESTGARALVDTPELRAATGLRGGDPARLLPLLRGVVVTKGSTSAGRRFSDEDLLLALREVAATLGEGVLTGARYDELRDRSRHPSAILVTKRLGWSEAVRRSGVDSRATVVRERTDRVSTERVVAAVRLFVDSAPRVSSNTYLDHARATGAPSLKSVFDRLGSWNDAVALALELAPGEAETVLATEPGVREDRELTEEEVAELVADYASGRTPSAVASRHRVTRERVLALVAEHAPSSLRSDPARLGGRVFTDDDVVAAIREVAASAGLERFTSREYEARRVPTRHPSLSVVFDRLGWSAATARAGLSTGTRPTPTGENP